MQPLRWINRWRRNLRRCCGRSRPPGEVHDAAAAAGDGPRGRADCSPG